MGAETPLIRQLIARLHPRRDRDIIEALSPLPHGDRSNLVRAAVRAAIHPSDSGITTAAVPAAPRITRRLPAPGDLDDAGW
jgi:hypothetical protein